MTNRKFSALIMAALSLAACSSERPDSKAGDLDAGVAQDVAVAERTALTKRPFEPLLDGEWIGNGISYGAFRDGEAPGEALTSREHILEDLEILAQRWKLIRLYGADQQSLNILEVIEENDLPIRVMQGIWLDAHKTPQENDEQVRLAIEYANRFPDIIVAVNVGNEILVDWSYHRLDDIDAVIGKIRQVRASIRQPVTVADDYNFWNKPHSRLVASEVDFVLMHAHPLWNGLLLQGALPWLQEQLGGSSIVNTLPLPSRELARILP